MTAIEKVYYNMDKLYDNFVDLPETLEVRAEFERNVEELIPAEKKMYFNDSLMALTAANEKQGFLYGFQYAVSLFTCSVLV